MKNFCSILTDMNSKSVVLYIVGMSEADYEQKSKDIHDLLEENQIADRLRITYLELAGADKLFQHLMNEGYYQAQQYKAVIIVSGYFMNELQMNQLNATMNKRGVKIFLIDDGIDSIDRVS